MEKAAILLEIFLIWLGSFLAIIGVGAIVINVGTIINVDFKEGRCKNKLAFYDLTGSYYPGVGCYVDNDGKRVLLSKYLKDNNM